MEIRCRRCAATAILRTGRGEDDLVTVHYGSGFAGRCLEMRERRLAGRLVVPTTCTEIDAAVARALRGERDSDAA